MARGVNKAVIIGTLGQDPEIKYTGSGTAIANVSIATSEQWKDKQTGDKQEKTEWHRIVMFGKLAEIAGQYLRKGSQAYFEGRIETQKWQDKEGKDRYTTQINASQMQMLGGRSETQNTSQSKELPARQVDDPEDDGFDSIPF